MYQKLRNLFINVLLLSSFFLYSCNSTDKVTQTNPTDYTIELFSDVPDHSGMWFFEGLRDSLIDEFQTRGLQLHADQIYAASASSLNDAIVRINIGDEGGGTGSFISNNGLVLTNHHVAFDAIASASFDNQNLLKSGFQADSHEEEIPVTDYKFYIPVEQRDVTDQINIRVSESLSFRESERRRLQIQQELIEQIEGEQADISVSIDDSWSGNRQIMSIYRVIRDVRLVLAPPESVGKFGGDQDNWMWPRHTPDFAFLRAYVAPDGSSQEYQPQNIPFNPDSYFAARVSDLKQGDFTLIAGFPGTTHRFESSYAFHFYETQQFPVLEAAFEAYLSGVDRSIEKDPDREAELASERASIANALKYYQGIRQGFKENNLTERKRDHEKKFQQWVQSDSLRNLKYGRVLSQLDQSYRIAGQMGDLLFLSFYTNQFSRIVQSSTAFDEYAEYLSAPDSLNFSKSQQQAAYDSNRTWNNVMDLEVELLVLKKLLHAFAELPFERRPLVFFQFFSSNEPEILQKEINAFLNRQASTSALLDTAQANSWLNQDLSQTETPYIDSLYTLSSEIISLFEQSRQNYIMHFPYLTPAQRLYEEGLMEFNNNQWRYADANFTLRLSAGEVMGYHVREGEYFTPFTSLGGMQQKYTGEDPFNMPEQLLTTDPSSAYTTKNGLLFLNFLTSNDITGGNSGSPVLNGRGEIIGIAFDGNIEGIIGDYYHIPQLSRTINLDIRFILFMLDEIFNADSLLNEIEIRHD